MHARFSFVPREDATTFGGHEEARTAIHEYSWPGGFAYPIANL